MTRKFGWIVFFFTVFLPMTTSARSFDILPPVLAPTCQAQFQTPIATVDGKKVLGLYGDLYCVTNDGDWAKGKSAILQQISDAAEKMGTISNVSISANLFDGTLVSKWLCSLNLSSGTTLKLFVQGSDVSNLSANSHLSARFLDVVDNCFRTIEIRQIGCDVHNNDAQCLPSATNTHHIKGIRIDAQKGHVYAFGSGNFTQSSMTRNVENWLVGTSQNPVGQFDCLFEFATILANNPELRFSQQRAIYNGCVALSPDVDDLRVIPLPFNERDFKSEITRLISSSKKVVIVGQFIESNWLFDQIQNSPNVRVTLLVDSAYYYASLDNDGREYNFISRDMAKKFFSKVATLPNVSVRFLLTNHNYQFHGQTNTVHARSILFDGESPAVMVGSVHWKDGAFVSNTEEQIFLYGNLAASQRAFLDDLVARSVVISDLPVASTAATPIPKAD